MRLLAILAGAACLAAAPSVAEANIDRSADDRASSSAQTSEMSGQLAAWQAREAQLFHIGWRLVAGNAAYCERTHPAIGILLHDAATYSDPDAVKAALGLSGDIGVQAVAPGSPADRAGIRANDTLDSVNEVMVAEQFPISTPLWQRLLDINSAMRLELSLTAPAMIGWYSAAGQPHGVAIIPVTACDTRFELAKGNRALADGARVILGMDFPGFAYPEDELAAAIAHELAHNLLTHRQWLDGVGRSQSNVRAIEREADRMMPWLLANAGYDPAAAMRFMAKWGPRHGGGLFRKRTHDGWDERVDLIEAEIALIEPQMAQHGAADWSQQFPREFAPDLPPTP